MLIFLNPPSRRVAPTLYALLFFSAATVGFLASGESAHGFGKKPIQVPPTGTATATKTSTSTATKTNTSTVTVTSTSTSTSTSTITPTDEIIRARWEGKARDGAALSKHVFDTLPALAPNLLNRRPADISDFCPAYDELNARDKKNFWVYFLSTMTELESNHNTDAKYTEAFVDAQGSRVVSRGLLQISIESGNGYGCGFRSADELHDPFKNLNCGLRILNKWIGGDGRVTGYSSSLGKYLGGARYWSVLRKDPNLGKIKGWNKALRMCAN